MRLETLFVTIFVGFSQSLVEIPEKFWSARDALEAEQNRAGMANLGLNFSETKRRGLERESLKRNF